MPDISTLFGATRWTAVRAAGGSDSTSARHALAELCQTYWQPLYVYLRRRGYGPHDAEDLTQGFFARLLRLESLKGLSRERGKFRAFLLASMKHYLADERDKASAQKRDARRTISLDTEMAEERYRHAPIDDATPDRLFDRQWALTLLETVVERLRDEYHDSGRDAVFETLQFVIVGNAAAVPYASAASTLGISEEAVRVAVHRLRKRYRAVLHDEIAQTVSDPVEVAGELRQLRRSLAP